MSKATERNVLTFSSAVGIAITAIVLGMTLSPKNVDASSSHYMLTWSCEGSDICHAGEQICCDFNPDIAVGSGSCYTNCPAQ